MDGLLATLREHSHKPWPQRVEGVATVLPPDAIPTLVEALADADPDLRLLAVEVLAELEPDDRTLPALVATLEGS